MLASNHNSLSKKKTVRALIPGFNPNFYYKYKGKILTHTKPFFTESNILTVQSIILTNVLLLMCKYHNSKQCIPQSVARIISPLAPYLDTNHYDDKNGLRVTTQVNFEIAYVLKALCFILNI